MKKTVEQEVDEYCGKLSSNLTKEEKCSDLENICKQINVKVKDKQFLDFCEIVMNDEAKTWIEKMDILLNYMKRYRGLTTIRLSSFACPDPKNYDCKKQYNIERNIWREKTCKAFCVLMKLNATDLLRKASCDCL